jgi:CheY-like chemotaxis protein
MNFLIVDDTSRARLSMKALMEVWGLVDEVHEAENGAEGLRMVEEFQPDIVLMDARLPVMSGLEATRQIKARWPQIKIIVMSVFVEYQALAQEAGADGFVSKSDPPEKLHKMIMEVLQR